MQNAERDAKTAAIFEVFMTTQRRDTLAMLLGLVDTKAARDRAYLDDMRRG